jgi:beta-glucosidase
MTDTDQLAQQDLQARGVELITHDGFTFKDLNRNGTLEPYEDWRLSPEERARDLVGRMTLEEKAGTMLHGTTPSATPGVPGGGTEYDIDRARHLIVDVGVTSMITRLSTAPAEFAEQNNALQELAEGGRLAIPLSISTDPRNSFQFVHGASLEAGSFSRWPETLGFAATRDTELVRRFADIIRQEYRAVGISVGLSPMADIACEPRWPRVSGTFGEDPDVVRKMAGAYVTGLQAGSDGLTPDSVLAVVKHWAGYGAAEHGWDSHNAYGKYARFSSQANFERHVEAFTDSFRAKVAGVMPTYSILQGVTVDGQPLEQVAGGFNRQLLTDLLRNRYGFDGVVVSDWGITSDADDNCVNGWPEGQTPGFQGFGTPWGAETLSVVDRFAKGINAGIDQFGGTEDAAAILEAVRQGKVTEARIDESVVRILTQKFAQGLFENPYADPAAALEVLGNAQFQAEARTAQQRALVLLKNASEGAGALPLSAGAKLYLHGIDRAAAEQAGFTVVDAPADADVAVVRTETPHEMLHPNYVFGSRQHEGNLAFAPGQADFDTIAAISDAVPTIVTVYMDRPAILTALEPLASGILVNFGISDEALIEVLSGGAQPEGTLPFALPGSMDAVEKQSPDAGPDSRDPQYKLGFGLRY